MNFVVKPSLEHMALVKIAISLWNQNDVRDLILKPSSGNLFSSEWKRIEGRVRMKAPQLSLPHLLKEKVLGFIKPIGLQIKGWMQSNFRCFNLLAHLPAELSWTPQGTVDRKKTAQVLIRDENLDISTRYKLACIYCLEDDIIQFWNSMTEDLKESVSHSFPIIFFWSHTMKSGDNAHINYKNEFHQSAIWCNKVAAEYFLQKLTPMERKESLVHASKYVSDADTLCFLISEMDEEQQKEVFRREPYKVLKSLLEWPCQSFFIKIASSMWDFLSKNDYHSILRDIILEIADGHKDWNYQMLFREFWQKSPNALKSFITNEIDTSFLIVPLFDIKDKEIIRLILKDASFAVKKKLIYCEEIDYYLTRFIRENEWDFLEFFIRECSPSKNEMLKFKEEFEKRMSPYFKIHFASKKTKWDLLFPSSDDSICKCDKRSLEESSSSK